MIEVRVFHGTRADHKVSLAKVEWDREEYLEGKSPIPGPGPIRTE
jgi:hypothetical protein